MLTTLVPKVVCLFTLLLATSALAQEAAPTNLGGPGESCRARADCKAGLKCMNQMCTDQHEGETCGATSDCGGELKCIGNKCTSTIGATHTSGGGASGGAGSGEWMSFKLDDGDLHPFVGLTVAGGFDTIGLSGNFLRGGFDTFNGAFLFALAGGFFVGPHQLLVELAPYTFIFDGKANGPAFEANASYAYFVPLTTSGSARFFWPIRFGAGIVAGGDNTLGLAFFQLRADLIGVAIQIGHAVIDLHLPTFRYAITDKAGEQAHYLDWLFGFTAGYAF